MHIHIIHPHLYMNTTTYVHIHIGTTNCAYIHRYIHTYMRIYIYRYNYTYVVHIVQYSTVRTYIGTYIHAIIYVYVHNFFVYMSFISMCACVHAYVAGFTKTVPNGTKTEIQFKT